MKMYVEKFCIILVTNKKYIGKSINTLNQIRQIGQYSGDVVLLIGDDLVSDIDQYTNGLENVIIKHFPDFDRSDIIEILRQKPIGSGSGVTKFFQFHKLYCFHTYFHNWKKCFYIDSGMQIFKPLDKIINLECNNKLLAHSDAYPYKLGWLLERQFDNQQFPELYAKLKNEYELFIDYFQSTMMLYDTAIIKDNTLEELIKLSNRYINSITNDQGILNLYFNSRRKLWEQIRLRDESTNYYDFFERDNLQWSDYIMLKYPRTFHVKSQDSPTRNLMARCKKILKKLQEKISILH
ncbi:MAG: hypothetical protein CVT88_08340 [Candidatus Altiarchaeales archaeon HGW-Altiarchaeales-1]|nr:MAG: hypothetical protein CVT89_06600 [Candidatus Altiarchaeales archaeon HGW-Altiarchaeales-2]PKP57848.1 MAG: hypothetical protein CVT88_08340 [Candidatus Altiarchaeales archaeon HGW-Altiarchaeales-1]